MKLLTSKGYDAIYIKDKNELKARYGNYSDLEALFSNQLDLLQGLDKKALFEYKYFGMRLLPLIQAELLSFLMPQDGWIDHSIGSDECDIFEKAYAENKNDLLLNMAVSIFWLDFWKEKIREIKNIKACCIFSGSLIYEKTLSGLLQNTPIRVFVLEHFYTGNEYYFEEKYDHIANNSDIRFKNIFNKLKLDFDDFDASRKQSEEIKAINKLKLKKNKNVKQPNASDTKVFTDSSHVVLIVGQVINDFSILETKQSNINSLQSYLEMIKAIINETNFNIIFKAHPWENQKTNIKRPITKEKILDFISKEFDKEQQARIVVLEDYNLDSLISQSKFIVGLCSQSLIEATMHGKKTIQMGKAFFGDYGFTYDCDNVEQIISIMVDSDNSGGLTTNEYKDFLLFITLFNQFHLVSVFNSGIPMLKMKLKENLSIPIVQTKTASSFMQLSYKESNRELSAQKYIELTLDNSKTDRAFSKKAIDALMLLTLSDKKLKKFASNPRSFFGDSKSSAAKLLGKIYF